MSDLELTVNGVKRRVSAPAATPLIYVLHNELGLTGSRYGCGLEQCGSCMVLIDGTPAYSCSREIGSLAGRTIETIESLGTLENLHPLQQAFIDEQAGQCGYCLSGIIMEAKALLDKNPQPSRADIITALDKHLCRCGTHQRIVRAGERAAEVMRGAK
jgi:nicotinate dehydrogenase subunit A